ncbi:MAG: transcriptional regulator [Gammaproteobacteria bacterium]|nr:transcriptional regulator [Gammaproteobacteria bacterium]
MLDIAAGRVVPKCGSPKIWFHSIKSHAEVLSDNNRELLKIIADEEPETINELAQLSGRQPSNLGRTLKTFKRYGFIKMGKTARTKKSIAKVIDFDILVSA